MNAFADGSLLSCIELNTTTCIHSGSNGDGAKDNNRPLATTAGGSGECGSAMAFSRSRVTSSNASLACRCSGGIDCREVQVAVEVIGVTICRDYF